MKVGKKTWSRRSALRTSLQALAVAGAARIVEPLAQAAPPVRALVCIYIGTGFDSNDALVPLDQYDSYASGRGSLAVPRSSLIELQSRESSVPDYGLHPGLGDLRGLFDSRNLAVVAGVGQDTMPAAGAPDTSMSFLPGGYEFPAWAARGAEITGFPNLRNPNTTSAMVMTGVSSGARDALYQVSLSHGFSTQFPSTSLGLQLQQVAALLQVGPSLGLKQPVFTCFHAGFEGTPDAQMAFCAELGAAMASFYQATVELGISRGVTAFTDTPWNRTLAPNAKGLATPAWAGHHLVLGGSVLGGEVYGSFPDLRLGSASDATGKGTWIPGQSRDRFTAVLAAWHQGRRATPGFLA